MQPGLITFKKFPFVRLLLSLIAGILFEWYLQIELLFLVFALVVPVFFLLAYRFLPLSAKFLLRWLQGVFILLLTVIVGALLTYVNNITNQHYWYGKHNNPSSNLLVTIQEPWITKTNSYKALASVSALYTNGSWQKASGNILLYFKKESHAPAMGYGSQLIIQKPIQIINNSGNPGAFDYKRYCLFHDITAQAFLEENDYTILPVSQGSWLNRSLFHLRNTTLNIIQKNIAGQKEQGVAEALLIGYRENLDKDLVQAYSNTGVVHIIAISGLHLGMIYGLMVWLFSFFKRYKVIKWVKPLTVMFVLWAFTLVAGAVPSILRSAVMFTFIVIGEAMGKRSNMYNTLSASAFCMLVANPFLLWDVGFLLSYAAVLGIVIFVHPVYCWLYYQNKVLDKIWKLTSVTIAAQIFTIPIVVFYFHQFPNLFLITNFIAVPLSGLILYGEIILLCFSFIVPLAKGIGGLLYYLLKGMDAFIENINTLPFAVWNNIQLNVLQTWLLLGIFILVCIWLMSKSIRALQFAIATAAAFFLVLNADHIRCSQQQKLVVYNVPKYTAIDLIQGEHYQFTGDDILLKDAFLRNFYLKPARILYRTKTESVKQNLQANEIININGKTILILDKDVPRKKLPARIPVDVIIISKNPRLYMNQLQQVFDCKLLVFDSSNPLWKIRLWKKDCDDLHLRFHSVADNGAFVMDL